MQLIVPMAGLGQRFVDAGYDLPKPLIPVGGVPMVVQVVNDLPAATRIVFIVHPAHEQRYAIGKSLRNCFPACRVVVAPGLTQGQACTVRLAESEIDLDEDVLVAACDATHLYDAGRFDQLRRGTAAQCIVWTYRGEPRVLEKPTAYGWVRTAAGRDDLLEVSCKRPISSNLLNDPVVSGFFWFRSARTMLAAIDKMVAENRRVNGEFYMDVVPNLLIESGRQAIQFQVQKYIGWGTPHDLEDYECWQNYFRNLRAAA